MNIYCINQKFLYETEKLLFLFLPFEKNTCLDEFYGDEGDYFLTSIKLGTDEISFKI